MTNELTRSSNLARTTQHNTVTVLVIYLFKIRQLVPASNTVTYRKSYKNKKFICHYNNQQAFFSMRSSTQNVQFCIYADALKHNVYNYSVLIGFQIQRD